MRSAVSELPGPASTVQNSGTATPRQATPSIRTLMSALPNCPQVRSIASRHEPSPTGTRRTRQPGQGVLVDLEAAEEALRALVVGLDLGLAAEAAGQLGEVDAAHLQQSPQELREEAEPRHVPGQVLCEVKSPK